MNIEINEKRTNLSGGELKKLSIIRGLAKVSSLLILDEPANSLDQKSKETLKILLENIKQEKVIILISHDTIFDEIIDLEIKL
ncbi:MAG: ATP-binding cassette domain-containing protein [Erysipelotrichaceae bacterium]|nr:ATP-binding cassette domain-containing protein [Erysipelotrichaceae bacterium]